MDAGCAGRTTNVGVGKTAPVAPESAASCYRGHGYVALPSPEGVLGQREIEKTIAEEQAVLEGCYRKATWRNSELVTYVEAGVLVSPDGTVRESMIAYSSTEDTGLEECLGQLLCNTVFSRPAGNAPASVYLPFDFRKGGVVTSCYLGHREVPFRARRAPASQQRAGNGVAGGGADETLVPPGPRGSLDKEVIREVIRHNIGQVRSCYEQVLGRDHALAGRVSVVLKIEPNGRIVATGIQSSTMDNLEVEDCVGHAVCNWQFPRPLGGGVVIVSYPFNFTSSR